ncbi:MAG: porin [Bacteroidetes bacterium]|nr:porin [Bacteroidota bacterium]
MRHALLIPAMGITLAIHAQQVDSAITWSAYTEVYYAYDLAAPSDHLRPGFLYNFNRHNEVNINLALLKLSYARQNVRGNIALMAGTYAQANMAAEPGMLQNLYEANAGVRLSRTTNLWLDVGILPGHIGFESAIGQDCWTLTRSLSAENTPYFDTGARIGYTSANGKWYAAGLLLNGWQRITRPTGNNTPAFGTQLTYKPNSRTTLNWSTFEGNDKPDTVGQPRLFSNLYAQLQASDRVGMLLGFDIGLEQAPSGGRADQWINPTAIIRFKANDRTFLAARWEWYQDKHGAMIYTGTPHGFNTMGYSLNLDRWIAPNVVWRMEARLFHGQDKEFTGHKGIASHGNTALTTSLAFRLP